MKKILLLAMIVAGTMGHAQKVKYGVRAGIDAAAYTISAGGFSASESAMGFLGGAFANIELSDQFGLKPEISYVSLKFTDTSVPIIHIPVLATYKFADSFQALLGPSINLLQNSDLPEKTKINIDLGSCYQLNENFDITAKYSLGMGGDTKMNGFFATVGYTF